MTAGQKPVVVTQSDDNIAQCFLSENDGDFIELVRLFARHRIASVEAATAKLRAELAEAVKLLQRTEVMPIPYPSWRSDVTSFLSRTKGQSDE